MVNKIPLVAIIGRTNVGKSTLFNALVGKRRSIVQDSPGVTRDRHYALANFHGAQFTLIDTGGLTGEQEQSLSEAVKTQTQIAIKESDLILAVLDGQHGPHPLDAQVVTELRNAQKKVIWVVNKCERPEAVLSSAEFYALGIDNVVTVSAAHRGGIKDLFKEIVSKLGLKTLDPEETRSDKIEQKVELQELEEQEQGTSDANNQVISIAVLGRPNVGKSSLINRILGEERLIASDLPGTTRDSIDSLLTRDGKQFKIVDTAGLRRKSKVEDLTVERFANLRTLRSLAQSDVAVLVIDATAGTPLEQDAKIAGLIHERGRPMVIVVNKWDAIEKDHRTVKNFKDQVKDVFKFAQYAPILFVSALSGRRCPSILQKAAEVYQESKLRISTSELNRIMSRAFHLRPPPVYRGEPIRMYFTTQVAVHPPTIVVFVNHPKRLNFSYQRYIKNALRKEYAFEGNDIRLIFSKKTSKTDREANQDRA